MEWIVYLLIGLALSFLHHILLGIDRPSDLLVIAIAWPVAIAMDFFVFWFWGGG